MALADDIVALNRRIKALETKQAEAKQALAVEEHKLKEVEQQLKDEGIDVSKMTEKQLNALLEKLSAEIEEEQERLEAVLTEAEKQFTEFQNLR